MPRQIFTCSIEWSRLANVQDIRTGGLTGSNLPRNVGNFFSLDKSRKTTIFGQFILEKMTKFVATKCHILRLKCTTSISAKAPPHADTAGGAHSAPPDPLAGFDESYF